MQTDKHTRIIEVIQKRWVQGVRVSGQVKLTNPSSECESEAPSCLRVLSNIKLRLFRETFKNTTTNSSATNNKWHTAWTMMDPVIYEMVNLGTGNLSFCLHEKWWCDSSSNKSAGLMEQYAALISYQSKQRNRMAYYCYNLDGLASIWNNMMANMAIVMSACHRHATEINYEWAAADFACFP